MTPASALVIARASEAWQPAPDELALAAVADEAAYVRAWGSPWTETLLDDALRVQRGRVARALRAYEREQLAATRATLGHK